MRCVIIGSANWSCGSQTVILRPRFPSVKQKHLRTKTESPGRVLNCVQPDTWFCLLVSLHSGVNRHEAQNFISVTSGEDWCSLANFYSQYSYVCEKWVYIFMT